MINTLLTPERSGGDCFGRPTLPLFICQPSQIKLDFKLNSHL